MVLGEGGTHPFGLAARGWFPSKYSAHFKLGSDVPMTTTFKSELKIPAIKDDFSKVTLSMAKSAGHEKKPLTAVIRENCISCSGGSPSEVRRCQITQCAMWPYRMGNNPFHTRGK